VNVRRQALKPWASEREGFQQSAMGEREQCRVSWENVSGQLMWLGVDGSAQGGLPAE
jgi:hypothetical protein